MDFMSTRLILIPNFFKKVRKKKKCNFKVSYESKSLSMSNQLRLIRMKFYKVIGELKIKIYAPISSRYANDQIMGIVK